MTVFLVRNRDARVPEVVRSRVVRALTLRMALTVSAVAVAAVTHGQQKPGQPDVDALLARVADRVERYFARAQSIVCNETVRLQPLGRDLTFTGGHVRQLVYELRVAWNAADDGSVPDPKVQRQLLTVDGRPPRDNDKDTCMDPKPVSPEPLGMLLRNKQPDYIFSIRGTGKTDGRASVTLDYKSRVVGKAEVTWKNDCVSIELPGRSRGRFWIDAATADVLRYDESLVGLFEFDVPRNKQIFNGPQSMVIERADTSTRYRPVAFHEPEETVLLPESISSLQVIRNSGEPQMRITQTFSNYRRFLTGGRVIKDLPSKPAHSSR
jgi:hypothetical protein